MYSSGHLTSIIYSFIFIKKTPSLYINLGFYRTKNSKYSSLRGECAVYGLPKKKDFTFFPSFMNWIIMMMILKYITDDGQRFVWWFGIICSIQPRVPFTSSATLWFRVCHYAQVMRVFQIEMQYTRPAGPQILSYTRIMQEKKKKKKRAAVECVAYRIFFLLFDL